MNRKNLMMGVIAFSCAISLAACDNGHTHSFESYEHDENNHWQVCSHEGCDEQTSPEAHSWNNGEIIEQPTYAKKGKRRYTCTVCSYTKDVDIDELSHTHTYEGQYQHDDNQHWKNCDLCGAAGTKEDHTWNAGVITKESTTDETGTKTFTCTVCSHTKTEVIPKKAKPITVNEITEKLDLVTDKQQYLIDNYKIMGKTPTTLEEGQIYIGDDYASSEYSHLKPVTLSWECETPDITYVVEVSENEDLTNAYTYTSDTKTIDIYNLKINTKYYYQISCGETKSQISSFEIGDAPIRTMNVEGITNVRDIGGKTNLDGKKIRQGLLYRGARYTTNFTGEEEITENGKKTLKDYIGLKTEIELRKNDDITDYTTDLTEHDGMVENAAATESVVPGVNYVKAPIRSESYILTKSTTSNNCDKVEYNSIKTIFNTISNADNYPIYYHCKIGTDRTGGISFLLGAILGLDEDQLTLDYCYSMLGNLWTLEERKEKQDRCPDYMHAKTWYTNITGASGNTLQEKATNLVMSFGITSEQIENFKEIMIEGYERDNTTYVQPGKNADVIASPNTFFYKWEKSRVAATFNKSPYIDNDGNVVLDVKEISPSDTPANDFIYIMYQPNYDVGTKVTISYDLECNSGIQYRTPVIKEFKTVTEATTTHVSDEYTIVSGNGYSLRIMFNENSLHAGSVLKVKNFTVTPVVA